MNDEDLSEPSVNHVPNCKLGHCGCYYTNGNQCCRCKKYQYERTWAHTRTLDRIAGRDPKAPLTDGNKRNGIIWIG